MTLTEAENRVKSSDLLAGQKGKLKRAVTRLKREAYMGGMRAAVRSLNTAARNLYVGTSTMQEGHKRGLQAGADLLEIELAQMEKTTK